jgi:hypothetical protein
MSEQPAQGRAPVAWGWWALTGLLGFALVIDVIAGNPLKLATSLLLFIGCLLSAAVRAPRSKAVSGLIGGCMVLAVILILYRLLGPGL